MATAPVRVTAETHRELTRFRLQTSAEIGRDISMGDIVSAAVQVAKKYPREIIEILTETESESESESS